MKVKKEQSFVEEPAPVGADSRSIASKALELCKDLTIFVNQEDKSFAIVDVGGTKAIHEINGKHFKHWLTAKFHEKHGKILLSTTIKEVLETLNAKAHFAGEKKETHIRIANSNGKIYIDLCNAKWECVEIGNDGWRILNTAPIMFVRKEGMSELPIPTPGGDINILEKFFNIYSSDFPLLVAWILGALRGKAPYPILIVHGEQGSGKSTATELLRMIVDPSSVPLRGVINDERDLVVSACSAHMLVMDNTSYIRPQMSDTLCRISTGGGFSKRKLYSDTDEVLIKLSNTMVINGIAGMPERPDLLERSIFLELPSVTTNRQTHQKIVEEFEKELPAILGAFYTVLSGALKELPDIKLTHPPRMADFAFFVAAAERALKWEAGKILNCLEKNQYELAENCIESNSFITAVLEFMKEQIGYTGTAHELLEQVNRFVQSNEVYRLCPYWPKTPQKVGALLSRFSPYLKRMGYAVARTRSSDKHSKRILNIFQE